MLHICCTSYYEKIAFFWHSSIPYIHLTLTCLSRSYTLMSTEAPPSARITTGVCQAIQTASSISQRELSRRRTSKYKCDRLTGCDWQVKPLVNCLLLLTVMWNLLGCNAVGGVKQLT